MCYAVQCLRCGKTGWNGCGQHVDSVMDSVPFNQRCQCRTDPVNEVPDPAESRRVRGTRSR